MRRVSACSGGQRRGAPVETGDHQHQRRHRDRHHPEADEERLRRVDVPDEKGEVHAEEAGEEGEREKDGGDHGEPAGLLAEPVGDRGQVGVERAAHQVTEGVDLLGDADGVVVDVAQEQLRLGADARGARRGERLQQVALRAGDATQRQQVALQPEDGAQRLAVGVLEHRVLDGVDLAPMWSSSGNTESTRLSQMR